MKIEPLIDAFNQYKESQTQKTSILGMAYTPWERIIGLYHFMEELPHKIFADFPMSWRIP